MKAINNDIKIMDSLLYYEFNQKLNNFLNDELIFELKMNLYFVIGENLKIELELG
jgi:hypothetical protein